MACQSRPALEWRVHSGFGLAVVLLGFVMLAIGFGLHERLQAQARAQAEQTLSSFAEIKTGELRHWLRDIRIKTAEPVDSVFALQLRHLGAGEGGKAVLQRRLEWLRGLSPEFRAAWVLDAQGQVVLRAGTRRDPVLPAGELSLTYAAQAMRLVDFHLNAEGLPALIALTPLLLAQGEHGTLLTGYLVVELDPAYEMYPMLRMGQPHGLPLETVLARVRGGSVEFLSPLLGGHAPLSLVRDDPAGRLLALSRPEFEGQVIEGQDYRDQPVFGVVHRFPEMDWVLITKLDAASVGAAVEAEFLRIALRLAGLLLLLVVLLWVGMRHLHLRSSLRQVSLELERSRLEKLFNFLVSYAKDIVLLMDEGGNILEANEAAAQAYGYRREALVGLNIASLRAPQTLAALAPQLQAADSSTGVTFRTVHRRCDGTCFPVEVSSATFEHEGRRYRQSIVRDISEAETAARALAQSEARFRAVFELAMVGLARIDPHRRWLAVNPALCTFFGLDRDGLLARSWPELLEADDRALEAGLFAQILAGEREDYHQTLRFVRADGSTVWGLTALRALRNGTGELDCLLLALEDITLIKAGELQLRQALAEQILLNRQLEAAQQQLIQSEKMASIGQLAAGVAHEINNPVGFVHSNLGTLRRYLSDLLAIIDHVQARFGDDPSVCQVLADHDFAFIRDDVQALVAESLEGIERVSKIVQDLKDFSRVGEHDWQWADLHRGLESTLNIAWNEIKYKARVDRHYGVLPPLWCLPSQLNQVFMNLLVNAAHSIGQDGLIQVRTGADDEAVWVEIEDNGCGIAPEHRDRLFDPFFTTKPVGQGTGLGLSLAFSIVRQHGGRIEVRSEPGRGSCFRVWLPLRSPAETGAAAPPRFEEST